MSGAILNALRSSEPRDYHSIQREIRPFLLAQLRDPKTVFMEYKTGA